PCRPWRDRLGPHLARSSPPGYRPSAAPEAGRVLSLLALTGRSSSSPSLWQSLAPHAPDCKLDPVKAPSALMLVPTEGGVGLTSVSLGLLRALEARGLRAGFVKPIRQPGDDVGPERSTSFAAGGSASRPPDPLPFARAEALLAGGRRHELLQETVALFEAAAQDNDVVVVEGLTATASHPE